MKEQNPPGDNLLGKALFFFSFICGLALVVLAIWLSALNAIPIGENNPPNFVFCSKEKNAVPEYRFAIHPLHNPQRLFSNFQPLVDIINKNSDEFNIKLIAARDYGSFEKRLLNREYDFALGNPLQVLFALEKGYKLAAKMGDDKDFYGLVVARRDSGIKSVKQLDGKKIIYPSPTALAATLMPKLFLIENGLDFSSMDESYSGSQESAIMNAYVGNVAAACTWPMPWKLFLQERPGLSKEMWILWQTEPLVNNGIVVRDDIPQEHIDRIVEILMDLPNSAEGRYALNKLSLSSFEKVNSDNYVGKVKNFLNEYRRRFPGDNINGMPGMQQ